jgi:DNA (cytosine-5)-methyltransferase 1
VETAEAAIQSAADAAGIDVTVDAQCRDSLLSASAYFSTFDCVITNPPWDNLKPDRREMAQMSDSHAADYREMLRDYDDQLSVELPLSQPARKYAGWGTNLSRCGFELAFHLTATHSLCGIVLPSSLLADQATVRLRRWLLEEAEWLSIGYYPAEARLFTGVDQPCVSVSLRRTSGRSFQPLVTLFDSATQVKSETELRLDLDDLDILDYSIPVETGRSLVQLLRNLRGFGTLADLEGSGTADLWLGRELDETRYRSFLAETGRFSFIKGRMIGRYRIIEQPQYFVREDLRSIPPSVSYSRVAWRDVSRRSQARRVQAALIPPRIVTGNSLHVGYFRDGDERRLRALLALMNSIPFEFQVRARLGTGHVSLGVVRQVRVPELDDAQLVERLASTVERIESGDSCAVIEAEVLVAKAYGLGRAEFSELIDHFETLPGVDVEGILNCPLWDAEDTSHDTIDDDSEPLPGRLRLQADSAVVIPNHYSAKLSDLDLQMAIAVPPGGNWKNIPESAPSVRVAKIRTDYAAGKGSRSTYYGRLLPTQPAYTINTYFARPGNGCHLHYDFDGGQHRVLSQREAARLQSFPDSFAFAGSRGPINKQIGNAVPPLLAYQVARSFPEPGQFIDLFSGAGGLSLGFVWAGWEPIMANDIDASFLETYRANIHEATVCGDIREKPVFDEIVAAALQARLEHQGKPLLVLGGPPCQGFSTAGKRRSMEDDRNHLFHEYKAMLRAIQPDGFVFENVTGLLNMEGGRVFEAVKSELETEATSLATWTLRAEQFGVPQRRTRVFLVGMDQVDARLQPPQPVTELRRDGSLFDVLPAAVSVEDALSDLPPISPGEDGSHLPYISEPRTPYQAFMRGLIGAEEYFGELMPVGYAT